ncbi:MAG TPA: polysaccharide biosynthesis/export family protein [Vicinamibacterales bacterium]|nr:polysaccharide biosynthesis/export family protein [Vicinamibacterales bacterium]
MTANFHSKNTDKVPQYWGTAVALCLVLALTASAQTQQKPAGSNGVTSVPPTAAAVAAPRATDPVVPPGYVIGTDDVLSIVYWKDKDMSADAKVRPDGRIALPLINEVNAAGLTPEELHAKIVEESKKYMEDANVTVVVREINSRKAFITGEVNKPGPYPLTAPTTVMQLISMAGGLREYANAKKIMIMRTENGKQVSLPFNYKDVANGKKLDQNVQLKPGDTVVVP